MICKSTSISVIDLFAGAGGFSLAAHQAGARVVACVENDPVACNTLRSNPFFHGEIWEADVQQLVGDDLRKKTGIKKNDPLIVVGGPPCQPFSKAAYWTEEGLDAAYRKARSAGIKAAKPAPPKKIKKDSRRSLVHDFFRKIFESKAEGFVFENVPSLKHPRNKSLYLSLVNLAKNAGFYVTEIHANAVNYGLAQKRERIFILGSKKKTPIKPQESHGQPNSSLYLKPWVTAGEALGDLNKTEFFEQEEVITGRWAEHLKTIPPGWNYKAHTAWAGHPNPTFQTETRFWNFLLKLSPKMPSWTLPASPGPWTGPFHWENRRLRIPEMAALQGFPLNYVLCGSRRDKVRQMGNAVPVPMATAMITSIIDSIS